MLVFGKVTSIDAANAQVKLLIPNMDNYETPDWIFVPQSCTVKDKSYNMPAINTLVAAVLDDEMQDGCIIGSIYNDEDVCILGDKDIKYITFEDGAMFKYDKNTSVCTVIASNISIQGDITLDGNLTATGNITDKTSSMQDMRDVYNSHTRTCPDGTTSAPGSSM